MTDKVFTDGMIVKRSDKAPEYVLCNLSVKVDEFTAWLAQNQSNGWVNIQCKVAKTGKMYAELDTWRPTQGDAAKGGIVEANRALRDPAGTSVLDDFNDPIPF